MDVACEYELAPRGDIVVMNDFSLVNSFNSSPTGLEKKKYSQT